MQKSISAGYATKFMKVENAVYVVWSVTNVKASTILLNVACPKGQMERNKLIQYRLNKRKNQVQESQEFDIDNVDTLNQQERF